MERIIIGVTGASGTIYAVKILEALINFPLEIHLVFSYTAVKVMRYETGETPSSLKEKMEKIKQERNAAGNIIIHDNNNLFAPIASGSFITEGMIIIPCSMACAGRIASCSGSHLVERAADVIIKERRKLYIAVRETPLSTIHLKALTSLSEAGAVIFPAMPSFYQKDETIEDIVKRFTSRILASFGLKTESYTEWAGHDDSKIEKEKLWNLY